MGDIEYPEFIDIIANLKKKYTDGEAEKCCENCKFYNTYRKDQPCCSCFDYINWELETDG